MRRFVVVDGLSLAMLACGSPEVADRDAVIADIRSQHQGVVIGGR